ncbi:MAG TPA: EamA family transporter [Acidobacteriaceae bacterium]|nr:EamA family transporter [Acidobacteriaceae bacterium]
MTDRKPLHLKTFFLLLVIVVAGPLGNVLLGKGMKQIGRVVPWPPSTLYHQGIQVFSSGTIWLGVLSLITFFVAYMLVLSWADYSYVQPASSFSYAVNAVLCYWLLSEKISPLRWAGIAVICLGVLVVGRTSPNGSPATEHG